VEDDIEEGAVSERRHQLPDKGQQDLDVLPYPNHGVPNLFNDRQRLPGLSCGRLPWYLPIEIKKAAKLLLELRNRHLAPGLGLVLLKFDKEGNACPVAVAHGRGIDDDLGGSRLLEDVQGLPPQSSCGARIYASTEEEGQGCTIVRETSLK
jgi:hypothetical protein